MGRNAAAGKDPRSASKRSPVDIGQWNECVQTSADGKLQRLV